MSRRPSGFAFALGIGVLASALGEQKPAPTPVQQVFRSRLDVVQVDVSVLDRARRPVRDLTERDFTVLEDGKPSRVVGLTLVENDSGPAEATGWLRDIPKDVVSNEETNGRLVVLVMDDALTPDRPDFGEAGKKIALSIIDKLGSRDLAAIIFTAGNRDAQDFTGDKTKLASAIGRFHPGLARYRFGIDANGIDGDLHFYLSSIDTVASVASYLSAVPNRRKLVFWVGPGVPFDLELTRPVSQPTRDDPNPRPMSSGADMRDLAERTNKIFIQAQRANVVIYPIDPTGLGAMQMYIDQRIPLADRTVYDYFEKKVAEGTGKGVDKIGERMAVFVAQERTAFVQRTTAALQDFLAEAAVKTGGRPIINTNDWDKGLASAFEENESYYLLGFEPASSEKDQKPHRLEIQVTRPGVEVRARNVVYPMPSAAALTAKPGYVSPEAAVLAKAIAGVLPDAGLPLKVTLIPMAVPGQRLGTVAVVLGVRQPVPEGAALGRITETTELQISAFTPEGDPRGTQRHTAHVVLRPGASGEAAYEVFGRIDLPPNRYRLRLAAFNATSNKSGSVFADVTVPDYSGAPASATPIIVSATPGRASAPRQLLSPLLPIAPTADREFSQTDRLAVLLRLYQSGKSAVRDVRLTVTIRGADGAVQHSEERSLRSAEFAAAGIAEGLASPTPTPSPSVLPPIFGPLPKPKATPTPAVDQFANLSLRTADLQWPIPARTMKPGRHLLTIQATAGDTVITRQMQFSIR